MNDRPEHTDTPHRFRCYAPCIHCGMETMFLAFAEDPYSTSADAPHEQSEMGDKTEHFVKAKAKDAECDACAARYGIPIPF